MQAKVYIKIITVLIGTCLLLMIAVVVGCSSSTSQSGTSTTSGVSFQNDVLPILTSNCIVCHQGSAPPGDLSLEPSIAYNDLVNAPSTEISLMRVTPGNLGDSYLVDKLNGTQAQAGGSGVQMPYGAPPLAQVQIDLISQWISEGAPNN